MMAGMVVGKGGGGGGETSLVGGVGGGGGRWDPSIGRLHSWTRRFIEENVRGRGGALIKGDIRREVRSRGELVRHQRWTSNMHRATGNQKKTILIQSSNLESQDTWLRTTGGGF